MTTQGRTSAPARFKLPSGKVVEFGPELDINKKETAMYISAYIAKNHPEDAKKLGITIKPSDGGFDQFLKELSVGGGNLVSSIEGLLDWATGDKNQDQWGGKKFSDSQRAQYDLGAQRDAATGELNAASIWRTVVESAPSTAVSMAIGGLAGLAAKAITAGAGVAAPVATRAVLASGIGAAAASEAGIGAGDAFNNTFQGVMNQRNDPNSPIRQSSEFINALRATGGNEDEAWSKVALDQASLAAPLAGVANAVPSLVGGTILAKTLKPVVERAGAGVGKAISKTSPGRSAQEFLASPKASPVVGIAKSAAKTSGVEGFEEALQSGGEMAAQNYAMSQVDPRIGVLDNVPEAAVKGGLAGALGGGIFGAGVGTASAVQQAADRRYAEGIKEELDYNQKRVDATAPGGPAEQARQKDAAKIYNKAYKQTLKEELRSPPAGQPAPASAKTDVPLLTYDENVKTETYDGAPTTFSNVDAARSAVFDTLVNNKRATIKETVGKGKAKKEVEVLASDKFKQVMTPDEKLANAQQEYREAQAAYKKDAAAYNQLPKERKQNYSRHMAASRKAIGEAAKKLRAERKLSETRMAKKAETWNKIAEANNLPQIDLSRKRPVTSMGRRPDGSKFSVRAKDTAPTPAQPEQQPTQETEDSLIERLAQLEDRRSSLRARMNVVDDPTAKQNIRSEIDSISDQIGETESRLEQMYASPAAPNAIGVSSDEAGNIVRDKTKKVTTEAEIAALLGQQPQPPKQKSVAETVAEQRNSVGQDEIAKRMENLRRLLNGEPEVAETSQEDAVTPQERFVNEQLNPVEATRLVEEEDLPVQRTDARAAPPETQKEEVKLSDDIIYEVAPVTNEGVLGAYNERLTQGEDYTGKPIVGYKIIETKRGLHGTNVGKPRYKTYDTLEEAEDALVAEVKDRNKINVSPQAYERVEQKKRAKEERRAQAKVKAEQAAARAVMDHLAAWSENRLADLNTALAEVGLSGRNIGVAFLDQLEAKTGLKGLDLGQSIMATFVTYGTKESPLGVIAINRNLIHPGMSNQEMNKVIRDAFNHEVVHAFVRFGYITPKEYSTMLRLIRKRRRPAEGDKTGNKLTYMQYSDINYAGLSQAQREEEAIAELIRMEGLGVSRGAMGGEVRGVIDRIVRIVRGLFGALQNKDFRNFVDFVEKIKSGEVASRIVSNVGIDPSNPMDPLGRPLNDTQANMRLLVPVRGNKEFQDSLRQQLAEFVKKNGRMPNRMEQSPIFGTFMVRVPIRGGIISESPESVMGRIPMTRAVDVKNVSNLRGGQTKVYSFASQGEAPSLGSFIDLSEIRKFDPELAGNLADVKVIFVPAFKKGSGGAIISDEIRSGQMVFLNGKQSDLIMISPDHIVSKRDPKELGRIIAHEAGHMVKIYAGRGPNGVMAGQGSSTGFDLNNPTPLGDKAQAGSFLERSLSYGANLIAVAVSNESMQALQAMRSQNSSIETPLASIVATVDDIVSGVAERFYAPLFELSNMGGEEIASATRATGPEVGQLIGAVVHEGLVKSVQNSTESINAIVAEAIAPIMDEFPQYAGMTSFVVQNKLTTQLFETLRNFDDAVKQNITGKVDRFPAKISEQMMRKIAEKIATFLDVKQQYNLDEGEQMARSEESDSELRITDNMEAPAQSVNPNKTPAEMTIADGQRLFDTVAPLSEQQLDKLKKNVGIRFLDKPPEGSQANIRASGPESLRNLNMSDVETLWKIMRENPGIEAKGATEELNAQKTSPRRPYRVGEVQDIINRLATIDPEMTRDGMSMEAMLKYERAWGAGRLKSVIQDAMDGKTDAEIARAHGLARSSVRAGLNEINVQQDIVRPGMDDDLDPAVAAKRIPVELLKKLSYRPEGDSLTYEPGVAFSARGYWNPARGPDYVRQEASRKVPGGEEGRSVGEILRTLREAGYVGSRKNVIDAFDEYEEGLRKKLDPSYYTGAQANMSSNTGNGNDGDNVVNVDFRKRRTLEDQLRSFNEGQRQDSGEAPNVAVSEEEVRERRKSIFGVPSDDMDIIRQKVFADYKKEVPFGWKKLNDLSEDVVQNVGRQLQNLASGGPENFVEGANRRASNYRDVIKRNGGDRAIVMRLTALADFFEWAGKRYGPPEGSQANIKIRTNTFDNIWKPEKISPEEWREAKYRLTKDEYDFYMVVNDMANEGMNSRQIADEMNISRNEDDFIEPRRLSSMAQSIRAKGFTVGRTAMPGRADEVYRRREAGEKPESIARDLYAEEIEEAIRGGADPAAALLRAKNNVGSIYSQRKKLLGGSRADMVATTAGKLVGDILKKNDARKEAIIRNAQRYAQNHTGDAVLDQVTALHRLFGKHMGNPENFIFDQINTAEGLERILDKYRQAGGKIDFGSNPVFAEDANRGKTRPEIETTVENAVRPALEFINTLEITDAMIEELSVSSETAAAWFAAQKENGREDNNYRSAGLYLLAKHAPEREAFIKAKRKQGAELRDGEGALGVGIQLDEAAKIVEFFERKAGREKLAQLSKLVRDISNKITEVRKAGGLIPKDIDSIFNFYVPARGYAERDGEEEQSFATISPGSRGRTALRQDPYTRGRLSLPDDPLTSMAQMLQVAVMRKNMNETLNSLRRLIENNDRLFEDQGKFVAAVYYEKPSGLDLSADPLWLRGRVIKSTDSEDVTPADDANVFYIRLSPEFVNISRYFMPSMHKKGDVEKLLSSTRVVEPAMNFLRSVRTSKNPAFLPVNLVRDIGTGFFNVEMYLPGSQLQFLSRTPQVLSQLTKDFFSKGEGEPTTKYGKLAKEFIENGGNQNLYVIDDYDRVASEIAQKLQKINGGPQGVTEKAKESILAIGDFFEKANNAAELVSRIAAYSIAKERFTAQGMSQAEAISRAVYIGRNLTVNFNKHGNIGKGMNNLYMFWNASIGGTSQILRAFESSPKVRAQLMSVVGLGIAMPFILRALLGDEYEKIPDWVKDRNFIIPSGVPKDTKLFGVDLPNYFTVPMPYGYSWFMTMGQNASESMYKAQDPSYGFGGAAQWMALRSVDGLMNNFAPTGASNDLLTLAAPTLADPVLELSMNKDWTGRPIMPEPGFRDTDRESQRYWSNTAPIYTAISDIASGLTGGHNRIDGLVEISPNVLEYITEFVFGGLGKFVNQNVSLVSGRAQDVSDVPILRSFVGTTTGEVSVAADYSSLQNKIKRIEKSIEDAQKAGNTQMVQDLERRYAFEADLIGTFRRAERLIEKQQSIRRAIEGKYRESNADKNENDRQRLEEIKERIKQIKSDAIDEVVSRRR